MAKKNRASLPQTQHVPKTLIWWIANEKRLNNSHRIIILYYDISGGRWWGLRTIYNRLVFGRYANAKIGTTPNWRAHLNARPKWDTRRPLLGFDTNYFHIIAGCWGRIVTWDGLLSTHDRRHGPPVTILFLFEILFDTMELTREKVCFDLWFGSKYRISNINIPHILQTSKTKSIVRKIVKFQCFLAKNFEIFPFCWNSAESQTIQKRKYGEIFIGDFSHRRQCKPTQL